MTAFLVFAAVLVLYGLVSRRVEGTPVTAPAVFVAVGLVLGAVTSSGSAVEGETATTFGHVNMPMLRVAQIALALILFSDAARIRLGTLRGGTSLPARLLVIGLPLTFLLGGAVAWGLVPGISAWEAFLLAAVLAPTDLALGQAVVGDRNVPQRIRQALNVEGGLNDGLAVPFFAVCLAGAAARNDVAFVHEVVRALGYGLLVGLAVGIAGGLLYARARRSGWSDEPYAQLAIVGLALLAWAAAEEVHGSGFLAAFVAGMATGALVRRGGDDETELAEGGGGLFSLLVFFGFGIAAAGILHGVGWREVLYAVLSLTLVRMLPVAAALVGARLAPSSVAFVGWFGPRGLASIVFGMLIVAEEPSLPGVVPVVTVATLTVVLSVFAHGITAAPLARAYAGRVQALPASAPEREEVPEIPVRPRVRGVAERLRRS